MIVDRILRGLVLVVALGIAIGTAALMAPREWLPKWLAAPRLGDVERTYQDGFREGRQQVRDSLSAAAHEAAASMPDSINVTVGAMAVADSTAGIPFPQTPEVFLNWQHPRPVQFIR